MEKFLLKQKTEYTIAYREIKKGRKESHWIWYIFPQIKGLGKSYMCQIYDIKNLDEAKQYLDNDILRQNLVKICKALLTHEGKKDIKDIMSFDDIKLLSSMTLFNKADEEKKQCGGIFKKVIDSFFDGKEDKLTLDILKEQENEKEEEEMLERLKKERIEKKIKEKLAKENNRVNNDDNSKMNLDSENRNILEEKIHNNYLNRKRKKDNEIELKKEMSIDSNNNSLMDLDPIEDESNHKNENNESSQKNIKIHNINDIKNYNQDINSNFSTNISINQTPINNNNNHVHIKLIHLTKNENKNKSEIQQKRINDSQIIISKNKTGNIDTENIKVKETNEDNNLKETNHNKNINYNNNCNEGGNNAYNKLSNSNKYNKKPKTTNYKDTTLYQYFPIMLKNK